MKLGIIGSGKYKNKEFVIQTLEELVFKDRDIIVSGHSPRNNYDNVDIWAEEWAFNNCEIKPIIYPAKSFNKDGFFARNKQIALESDKLLIFINRFQYKSGTWNTLKYFIEKENFKEIDIMIYDEDGNPWHSNELPIWIKNKL